MALTIEEAIGLLPDAMPVVKEVKEAIDAVEAVPKDQRKPSTYISAANRILGALGPFADRLEAEIKD